MGRIRSFSAALLALLCVLIVVPSPASANRIDRSPQIREIDARIEEARARIDTWNHRLNRWQVRVGKVAVSVERLTALTESRGAQGTTDVLRRSTPRRQILSYRLHRAHRAMRAILTDPEVANAQQQIQAFSAYVVELEGARDELARAKRKARHAGGVVPGEPLTYEAWARGFLARVSAPACQENLTIVVTWETSESTEAAFNPLATTHAMDGATDFNSVGVKNYRSLEPRPRRRPRHPAGRRRFLRLRGHPPGSPGLRLGGDDRDGDQRVRLVPRLYERRLHHRPAADREGELRRPRRPPHLDGLTFGPGWRSDAAAVGRVALRTSLVTCHNDDSWTR